jgi:hypothetical protein
MIQELKIPFGEAPTGLMVRPGDIPRGLACDCVCPQCRAPLVAKQGEQLVYHFAHAALSATCQGAVETAIHRMAKQIVLGSTGIVAPPLIAHYRHHPPETITPATWLRISHVRIEVSLGNIVPDIMATVADFDLAIEILVTHAATAEKLAVLRTRQLPAFEIDLSGYRNIAPDDLEPYVLRIAPRKWLFNPRQAIVNADLAARTEALLEQKRQERQTTADEAERRRTIAEADAREEVGRSLRDAEQARLEMEIRHKTDLNDITAWAAAYYPAKATPPPESLATRFFSPADIVSLFNASTSAKHHLALVDQEPIRDQIDAGRHTNRAVVAAVAASWERARAAP